MNKKISMSIAIIIATIFTLSFLLVDVTYNFLISYIFTLIFIGAILYTNLYVDKKEKNFPWVLGVPIAAFRYFIIQVIISIIIVILEQVGTSIIKPVWVFILYMIILLIFIIKIILLKESTKHIENVEDTIKLRTQFIKNSTVELEIMCNRENDINIKKELVKLRDKIRYSDPMSSDDLYDIENEITNKINNMKIILNTDFKKDIHKEIELIINLLDKRNIKCKSLK